MSKIATEFEKMIHSDRSRKKNEALAAKIFGKERRASAPAKAASPAVGGKLAARAGVKKQRVASTAVAQPRTGNINSEWTHDLHDRRNARDNNPASGAAAKAPGSLASRISRPGETPKPKRNSAAAPAAAQATASTRGRQQRRAAQVANALTRAEQQQQQQPQRQQQSSHASGLSIRGIAAAVNEPLVIMAQNFAPGTTAADIESAMTPVGGLVNSCRILKTTPLVIAEIVFESREGAERVIATFNNQTADGRVLHVYPKVINSIPLAPHSNFNTQAAPRAQARGKNNAAAGHLVDGSLGFDDPMDTDGLGRNGNLSGQLYSDDLVGARPAVGPGPGRRGRGRGGRR